MFNNWEDGYTYELYEMDQKRYKYFSNEETLKNYRIDWVNEEYEDTEFVNAYDESDAEEKAWELIPEDARITAIRVA